MAVTAFTAFTVVTTVTTVTASTIVTASPCMLANEMGTERVGDTHIERGPGRRHEQRRDTARLRQRVPPLRSVDYQRRRPCVGFHRRIGDHAHRDWWMRDRSSGLGIDDGRIVPSILIEEVFGRAGSCNRPVLENDELSNDVFPPPRALDADPPRYSRRRGA